MSTRLLSFCSDIEQALAADQPSTPASSWTNTRTINYGLGLAKLCLGNRSSAGTTEARGSILLQSYKLADSTPCFKADFAWTGSARVATHSVYSKPDSNWTIEAKKIAAEWLAGIPLTEPSFGDPHSTGADSQARAAV